MFWQTTYCLVLIALSHLWIFLRHYTYYNTFCPPVTLGQGHLSSLKFFPNQAAWHEGFVDKHLSAFKYCLHWYKNWRTQFILKRTKSPRPGPGSELNHRRRGGGCWWTPGVRRTVRQPPALASTGHSNHSTSGEQQHGGSIVSVCNCCLMRGPSSSS